MKRTAGFAALLTIALVLLPTASFGAWSSGSASAGSATATSVLKAPKPVVTRSGSNVVISWSQGTLANLVPVKGYVVRRTVGATTTTICTVAEPTRSCTDTTPAPGLASYVVRSTVNNWTGPSSDATSITFDSNAPTTTLTSNPAPNANGYNVSAPTITLSATDAETSVASITYQIGAAAPVTVNAVTTSFTVSSLGNTTITYFATDAAGNVETAKTYTVKRDGTAPTTTVSANPAPNANGYFTSAPTLTLSASDAETSVAAITYQIGAAAPVTVNAATTSFTVSSLSNTTITYFATDAAGNVETAQTYTVKRDGTAPTTTLASNPTPNANGYNLSAPTITLSATDAETSVASITYKVGAA